MDEYAGIGLAAPQVHQSVRLFVAILDTDGQGDGGPIALINPEITMLSSEVDRGDGRAASASPTSAASVLRSPHVKVSALNRDGKRVEIEARTLPRRASSSTRPIIWTACCSSIACARSNR